MLKLCFIFETRIEDLCSISCSIFWIWSSDS